MVSPKLRRSESFRSYGASTLKVLFFYKHVVPTARSPFLRSAG
jgi:hypothetical protein